MLTSGRWSHALYLMGSALAGLIARVGQAGAGDHQEAPLSAWPYHLHM